jgi:hypothetical protein
MTILDRLRPLLTGKIRISTVIYYASYAICSLTSRCIYTDRPRPLYIGSLKVQAFFLDAACREPYTAACAHAVRRHSCTPYWFFMNLTGETDPDSAHALLHYSGESAALDVWSNVFRWQSEAVACGVPVGLTQPRL